MTGEPYPQPWTTAAYQEWNEGIWRLVGTYSDRYARLGHVQRLNAARAQVLRHIRQARAQMSPVEATAIWSASGICNACERPIQPGDPYVVRSVGGGGGTCAVLVCYECEFEPCILRLTGHPSRAAPCEKSLPQVRAEAAATIERCKRERWSRQDRLKHRGLWWRLKRWADWWSDLAHVLSWTPPKSGVAGAAGRVVGPWLFKRALRRSLWFPTNRSAPAERLVAQYSAGRRGFLRSELASARLRGVRLEEADLSLSDLSRAELSGANLRSARLVRADLEESYLCSADLTGASLERSNLFRAFLCKANLEQANLGGADLTEANLYEATVTEGQLARAAKLKGVLLPDGTIHL